MAHIFHGGILSFAYLNPSLVVLFIPPSSFSSSSWLLIAGDSRPVFIKAGCDRNHPKVDFCPRYDNPALTRLDRLLGPFSIRLLLKWIQCRCLTSSWHHQYLLSCPAEWWRFRVHLSRDMLVSCSLYNISLPMSFTKETPSLSPTIICLVFYLDPEATDRKLHKLTRPTQ